MRTIVPRDPQVNPPEPPKTHGDLLLATARDALRECAEQRRRDDRNEAAVLAAAVRVGVPYAECVAILAGDD